VFKSTTVNDKKAKKDDVTLTVLQGSIELHEFTKPGCRSIQSKLDLTPVKPTPETQEF